MPHLNICIIVYQMKDNISFFKNNSAHLLICSCYMFLSYIVSICYIMTCIFHCLHLILYCSIISLINQNWFPTDIICRKKPYIGKAVLISCEVRKQECTESERPAHKWFQEKLWKGVMIRYSLINLSQVS